MHLGQPKTPIAYYKRGLVYIHKGLNSKAIPDLEAYLQLNPKAEDRAEVEKFLRELG